MVSNFNLREKIFIILASGSPRRKDLLALNGFEFCIVPSSVTELDADYHNVRDRVVTNARMKAEDIIAKFPRSGLHASKNNILLAADTLVVLNEHVFGKPRDLKEAHYFLKELGGNPHSVLTGVSLYAYETGDFFDFFEETMVTLIRMTNSEISDLFKRVSPLDKAAGYGYQDAPEIVEKLTGSKTNVFGLPMKRVIQELQRFL